MTSLILDVEHREVTGKKVKALRRDGLLPAVVYGFEFSPQHLVVKTKDFDKVYGEAGGNTIVELKKPGAKENINVLIHQVAKDVVTGYPLHVDFYRVKMDEKITTKIPLNFVGQSKAVEDLDGSLITNKSEIEVECLPGDLISEIEIDISVLEDFESALHISDLKVPMTIKILDDPEETIATVEPPRSEEEMAELEEPVEEGEMPESEMGDEEDEEGEEGEVKKDSEEKEDKDDKK